MNRILNFMAMFTLVSALGFASAAEGPTPEKSDKPKNSVEQRLKMRFVKPDTRWKFLDILWPLLVLGGVNLLIVGAVMLPSRHKKWTTNAIKKIYEDAEALPPVPGDPEVTFVFHTYQGLLTVGQTERREQRPCAQALYLLKRLHYFNLKWCWFSRGGLFVPFLSVGNYLAQKSSIRAQLLTAAKQASNNPT